MPIDTVHSTWKENLSACSHPVAIVGSPSMTGSGVMCEQIAAEFVDQTVVAVCHAGVIMASIRVLFGIPLRGTSTQLRPVNTGLTDWEYDPNLGRWTLHSFNEQAHLLGLPEESQLILGRAGREEG